MARILLVRHAQTKLNKDDRFWGKTDLTLSDYGEWQAAKLRDRLAEETIDAVYTSTLSRARQTAEIITSGHDCTTTACDEIDEVNFGFIEGLTYDEIKQQHPDLAEKLTTILQDRELAERMGRAARARVEREFRYEQMIERILGICQQVVRERAAAR